VYVEEIWDTERHKSFVETAKVDRDGDFKEEIEWWETVYDEMMASVKTDIVASRTRTITLCFRYLYGWFGTYVVPIIH
jgi:hypothetical protein